LRRNKILLALVCIALSLSCVACQATQSPGPEPTNLSKTTAQNPVSTISTKTPILSPTSQNPPTTTSLPATTVTTEPPAISTPAPTSSPTCTVTTSEPVTPTATTKIPPSTTAPSTTPVSENMRVYFLDVGQADATLLKGPDFTILIDAGDYTNNDVVPYLKDLGVTKIDLLIGTHAHADHIGQFPQVIDNFEVGEVWLSGSEHTSRTFERAIDAILASDAAYYEPRAGEEFNFGSLEIYVLHPETLIGDPHEDCISIKAVYGEVAFVFTGDAEAPQEQEMIARGHELEAQILQLGHHGSSTSSCQPFLDAVNPEIAVYSAGEDNSYGHPHDETIDKILSMGIDLYGTDVHGSVIIETDGSSYTIDTDKEGDIRAPPVITTTTTTTTAVTLGGCEPGQININTASFEDLQKIIHIGPARAQEIINLRPFTSIHDLTRVDGIGPSRLEDIIEQGIACVGDDK